MRFFEDEGLRQAKVRALFAELPTQAWQQLSAGQGSKGERYFDWAWIRLWDLGHHAPDVRSPLQETGFDKWLLARRNLNDPDELDYYLVFAPEHVSLEQVVQVAGTRWTIETGFEALKQEAGLNEYETRSWTGWYRHITLSLLAHTFLAALRAKELKKGGSPYLVELSIQEVKRLLTRLIWHYSLDPPQFLAWSFWRRRHQARAKVAHYKRRGCYLRL